MARIVFSFACQMSSSEQIIADCYFAFLCSENTVIGITILQSNSWLTLSAVHLFENQTLIQLQNCVQDQAKKLTLCI